MFRHKSSKGVSLELIYGIKFGCRKKGLELTTNLSFFRTCVIRIVVTYLLLMLRLLLTCFVIFLVSFLHVE
jgi:hypothetical protein